MNIWIVLFFSFNTTSVRSFCFHYSCPKFETPMAKFWSVENQCTEVAPPRMIFFFLFRTPKQRANKASELVSEKILLEKELQSTPAKKKKKKEHPQ